MPHLPERHWDVLVVGAGLGGLAAAAALTRQGQRVLVLEQHDVPGGYAHRFLRRPRGSSVTYSFDVALHQIGGLAPERWLARQLRTIGVLDGVSLRRFDVVYRTRGPAHDLTVSGDVAVYEQQLTNLFPGHRAGIRDLLACLAEADLGVGGYANPSGAALRLLGRSAHDVVHQHVPDDRFVAIFTSLWAYLGLPPAELCALTFAQAWASYHRGGCYYVEGGGQALSNAFVSVIEAGGGQVLMKCPVVSIETARGTVTGAVTGRHGDLFAPVVISNASAPDTFRRLLRAPASPARATRTATSEVASTTSIVETYVGLRGRAEELGFPDRLLFTMADYDCQGQWSAVMRGDIRGVPTVVANHNLSDPRHVPRGRSILNVAVLANGAEWMDLDDDVYATRKREVEHQLLEVLAARLPDLRDRLEICETGTPRTMKRYSWNPDGSIYGLPPSARTHPLRRPGPRTDITGLYLAGAWTFPAGGFHGAITSGLHTAGLVAADLSGAQRQASRETWAAPTSYDRYDRIDARKL